MLIQEMCELEQGSSLHSPRQFRGKILNCNWPISSIPVGVGTNDLVSQRQYMVDASQSIQLSLLTNTVRKFADLSLN